MRTRSIRAVVSAALASVALAACGEQAASPRERLSAASEATFAERTASFSMEMDMQMGPSGSGMSFTTRGKGAVNLDAGRGHMEMSMPGADTAMSMVFDGDVMYLRLPFGGAPQKWIRQDASEMSRFGANQTMASRPSAWLAALDDVRGEIRSLGPDTVRGTDVQGFGFTARAVDLWGAGLDSAILDTIPASLKKLEIPTKVWLDAEDRVRRMAMEIDMGKVMEAVREMRADTAGGGMGPMAGMQGTATMTVEYFDFGTEVDVQVPDSSNVVTMEELRRQQARQSGGGRAGLDTRIR